jgi:hypothetical protein
MVGGGFTGMRDCNFDGLRDGIRVGRFVGNALGTCDGSLVGDVVVVVVVVVGRRVLIGFGLVVGDETGGPNFTGNNPPKSLLDNSIVDGSEGTAKLPVLLPLTPLNDENKTLGRLCGCPPIPKDRLKRPLALGKRDALYVYNGLCTWRWEWRKIGEYDDDDGNDDDGNDDDDDDDDESPLKRATRMTVAHNVDIITVIFNVLSVPRHVPVATSTIRDVDDDNDDDDDENDVKGTIKESFGVAWLVSSWQHNYKNKGRKNQKKMTTVSSSWHSLSQSQEKANGFQSIRSRVPWGKTRKK